MIQRFIDQHKKGLIILGIGAMLTIYSCKTHHKTTTDNFTSVKRSNSLERGKNLTFSICGGCHYNKKDERFTGHRLGMTPRIAGKVYSANLTKHKSDGIPQYYTDAELIYLIKTGITKEGMFIPYMLRPNISDKDMNDIIVFLRSDDPSLDPSPATGHTKLNFIGKLGKGFIAKPQQYKKNDAPDENDAVAYGRYLVDNVGCFHCHSKKAMGINYMDPEKTKGYMAGGAKAKTPAGKVRGSNLTFDKETGIGNYSQEEFRTAVQKAIDKEGHKLKLPMEAFPLTDKQTDAIYAYLKSLPAKHHRVKKH